MKTSDVDPAAPPDEKRCTSQIFGPIHNRCVRACINPGSHRQLLDADRDPPAIIFDVVYASAVLRHFGTRTLKDVLSAAWKDTFYPHGIMSVADSADQKEIIDARAAEVLKRNQRISERNSCREIDTSHSGPDALDMIMFLPYAFLPKDDRDAMFRRAREKAEAAEKERLQDIVGPWARDVDAST